MAVDSSAGGVRRRAEVLLRWASGAAHPFLVLRDLLLGTMRICLRYRVTGLAAEAGFFALLSLPPLVLGLVASAGWIGGRLGTPTVDQLRGRIQELAETFLTAESVQEVILPTVDDVTTVARPGVVGIGALLALWSGSRVLNVYIDTIAIMYGLGGHRGIIRSRILSFSLYVVSLLVGALSIPLVLIGPSLLGDLLPDRLGFLLLLYWPFVTVVTVAGLASLYHVSTPVRTAWIRDLPGAVLALLLWLLSSFALRWVIGAAVGSTSIYGPLAAPIVILIWLYFLAIAVLIGAAMNASIDQLWPEPHRERARRQRGEHADTPPLTPVPDDSQVPDVGPVADPPPPLPEPAQQPRSASARPAKSA